MYQSQWRIVCNEKIYVDNLIDFVRTHLSAFADIVENDDGIFLAIKKDIPIARSIFVITATEKKLETLGGGELIIAQ